MQHIHGLMKYYPMWVISGRIKEELCGDSDQVLTQYQQEMENPGAIKDSNSVFSTRGQAEENAFIRQQEAEKAAQNTKK